MEFILGLALKSLNEVYITFLHNWPYLLVSIVIAALLKRYLNPERASEFLRRYSQAGVAIATGVAVTTPLCSCGTTAVILGMMASMMPWAPIIAFMVASPLTSPEELFYSAGLFGWPFAIAFFLASIVLGFLGGGVGSIFEKKGWLANQMRYNAPTSKPAPKVIKAKPQITITRSTCTCSTLVPEPVLINSSACGCSSSSVIAMPVQVHESSSCSCSSTTPEERHGLAPKELMMDMFDTARRLLPMFVGFAFVGYFLNGLIPSEWVSAVFGSGNVYSVPLAATLGLPLYINSEASLPLIRALIDNGMSQGAALAFMISGAGTSLGAVAGMLTIARWRVVAIVVGVLWAGAILSGYLYNLILATNLI